MWVSPAAFCSREGLEERGIATCFLAVGMATWSNTRGTAIPVAPILLREASIAASGAAEEDFQIALTGETDVNPTLLHLLEEQYQVTVDGDELIDLIGPRAFDPQPVFEHLRKSAAAVPGFAIAPRHVLGTFSYAKLPMVTDLAANLEALTAHDVIAAIAGNREAQVALSATGSEVNIAAPDHTPPADEFLVLDADSSQSYAVNAAVAGQSLVVAGPPGTGKSQTIANLIATHVARGQSVLFVAEKRAAISAVLDRLSRVGLADLVLDMHEGAGSRSAIAQNLAAALRSAATVARPDQTELHERLVTRRGRLNAHDNAMHQQRSPWSVSVFQAQCALIDLAERHGGAAGTEVRLRGGELNALTDTSMRALRNDLYEYASLGGLTLTRGDSPWVGAHVVSAEQAEAALATATRLQAHTAPDTRRALADVLAQTGLATPQTLAGWRDLLGLLDEVSALLGRFRPEVFAAALPELIAATGSRIWRKAHSGAPGASAGWGERRSRRKTAKALWTAGKSGTQELHAALAEAQRLLGLWTARRYAG